MRQMTARIIGFESNKKTDNDKREMTQEEYEEKYGHSRHIPVSLRLDETYDNTPFILTVGYISQGGNIHRAVELDNEIMPYIRKAVEEYKKNRKAEWSEQRIR